MLKKIILLFVLLGFAIVATPLTRHEKIIVNKPTHYKNITLNLAEDTLIITNNATLEIENCIIKGIVSPDNPILIQIQSGKLLLKNSYLFATTDRIPPTPSNPSLYSIINVAQGNVDLFNNHFTINKMYSVSLLTTNNFPSDHFIISNNIIKNFHGGFLLKNSSNALISNNHFTNVSISNILTVNGNNNKILSNKIFFSGNNNVGDAIDILDSQNTVISHNYIINGSCYSIFILRSKNVQINNNSVLGGITYGIYITPHIGSTNRFLAQWIQPNAKQASLYPSAEIIVHHNYLSQNRFGLSAKKVDGLYVSDNIFIQHFSNQTARQFWTNNDILLKEILHVEWKNNYYKEAFTQDPHGSNTLSKKIINFPLHGGIMSSALN